LTYNTHQPQQPQPKLARATSYKHNTQATRTTRKRSNPQHSNTHIGQVTSESVPAGNLAHPCPYARQVSQTDSHCLYRKSGAADTAESQRHLTIDQTSSLSTAVEPQLFSRALWRQLDAEVTHTHTHTEG